MSVKRTKFHYTFSKTFSIATIYEDDRIICKDMLIEEETLDKIIDLLNEMATKCSHLENENRQLREQVQILKKEVRDFLHLCDVCDIQSHLSDECEEVLNDDY